MHSFLRTNSFWSVFSLLIILIVGGLFRFHGLNWDQGFHLHPDERMITMVAEEIHLPQMNNFSSLITPDSPLNPHFFAYGSLPIYFLKFCGWFASFIYPPFSEYAKLNLIGRMISVVADLGTIVVIYLIGKRLFSNSIGLIASFLYSLSVLPIQLAHFYAVDTLLTFFVLTTLYRLTCFVESRSYVNSFWVGLFFGLALATKISAFLLIAPIGATLFVELFIGTLRQKTNWVISFPFATPLIRWFEQIIPALRRYQQGKFRKIFIQQLLFGLFMLTTTIITFLLFEPYALIDFGEFWNQLILQRKMTNSAFTFPFTLSYVSTPAYLYPIKQLVLWGMGIPLGIVSITGCVFLLYSKIRRFQERFTNKQWVGVTLLLVFFLVYFIVVGKFAVKFMRYMLPVYPLLSIFASWFLVTSLRFHNHSILRLGGKFLFTFTLLFTFGWALSFSSIYSRPNTRYSASKWINANVPVGSTIATEYWDDRVPLWGNYQFLELPLIEPEHTATKWERIETMIEKADYIVIASHRIYGSILKLQSCQTYPDHCYPRATQYYLDLFSGNLGFRKVAELQSLPAFSVFGKVLFEINDFSADENFTVFDHPKIMVFQKVH